MERAVPSVYSAVVVAGALGCPHGHVERAQGAKRPGAVYMGVRASVCVIVGVLEREMIISLIFLN